MKKGLLFFIFLASAVVANTQPYPLLGSPNGNTISVVNALRGFQLPRGVDTTLNGRNDSVGMLFYKLDKSVWLRVPSGGTANKWVKFGADIDSVYATQSWVLTRFPQLALQYNDPSWIGTLNVNKIISFVATNGQVLQYNGSRFVPTTLNFTPQTRTISTTAPLQGGGDLSADRTLSIDTANASYISRARADSNYWRNGGNSFGTNSSIGTNNLQDLIFKTNNVEAMRINSLRQVSIGTSVSSGRSLMVQGSIQSNTVDAVANANIVTTAVGGFPYFRMGRSGHEIWYIGSPDNSPDLGIASGSFNNYAIYFKNNFNGTSNVGIGTTNPLTRLHLAAPNPVFRIDDTNGNNSVFYGGFLDGGSLSINRNPSTGVFTNTGKAAAQLSISGGVGESAFLFFTTTANNAVPLERMRITGAGNILIGTATSNPRARVLINSTNQGFMPPKMTAAQASAIAVVAGDEGLMLYVTDTNATFTSKGWWGWSGTVWEKLNN